MLISQVLTSQTHVTYKILTFVYAKEHITDGITVAFNIMQNRVYRLYEIYGIMYVNKY